MLESYVQILTEGLEKKKEILLQIMECNQEQATLVEYEPFDMEAFDKSIDQQSLLIEEINRLDIGFELVYDRNREELQANKERFKQEIIDMKQMITEIMELGIAIQTAEERNKQQMEARFTKERSKVKQRKVGNKAAMDYYKTMNQVNYIDPQLLDQKN